MKAGIVKPISYAAVINLIRNMDSYASDKDNKASMRLLLEETSLDKAPHCGHECWIMLNSLMYLPNGETFKQMPLTNIAGASLINNCELLLTDSKTEFKLVLLSAKKKVSEAYNLRPKYYPKPDFELIDLTKLLSI